MVIISAEIGGKKSQEIGPRQIGYKAREEILNEFRQNKENKEEGAGGDFKQTEDTLLTG